MYLADAYVWVELSREIDDGSSQRVARLGGARIDSGRVDALAIPRGMAVTAEFKLDASYIPSA